MSKYVFLDFRPRPFQLPTWPETYMYTEKGSKNPHF